MTEYQASKQARIDNEAGRLASLRANESLPLVSAQVCALWHPVLNVVLGPCPSKALHYGAMKTQESVLSALGANDVVIGS